jgi:hypothetical protein
MARGIDRAGVQPKGISRDDHRRSRRHCDTRDRGRRLLRWLLHHEQQGK